jgi:hypothetical protein
MMEQRYRESTWKNSRLSIGNIEVLCMWSFIRKSPSFDCENRNKVHALMWLHTMAISLLNEVSRQVWLKRSH